MHRRLSVLLRVAGEHVARGRGPQPSTAAEPDLDLRVVSEPCCVVQQLQMKPRAVGFFNLSGLSLHTVDPVHGCGDNVRWMVLFVSVGSLSPAPTSALLKPVAMTRGVGL